ncbi:MAG: UDP-N-acetylmuramoyl-L-alanine--D-glutamate ligase [Baekduia sp.]
MSAGAGSRRPPLPPGPYLVVGLARSGAAVATALAARGERVIAVDRGAPEHEPLGPAVEVRLGDDGLSALADVAAVVTSPGVPAEAPVLVAAAARGLPVLGELECAWRMVEAPVIAVTGTNGKTTTSEMLGHLLRELGTAAAVVGNVGTAYSSLATPGDALPAQIVCEISSFQLEWAPAFAPEAAVLLNLGSDHLDRHGTIAEYHRTKLSLFAHQREGDLAVVPADVPSEIVPGLAERVTFGPGADADMVVADAALIWRGTELIPLSELGAPGPHNALNAAAAAAVVLSRGADPRKVATGLATFVGVPHRLEPVIERGGVLWVNDSKATNVDAAVVAMRSFGERPLHVIVGGRGKGESYAPLREPLAAYGRRAYVIGEEAGAIAAAIDDVLPVSRCGSLEEAAALAAREADSGDVVLLAPACASQDQFRDFEERGKVFADAARRSI